MSEPASGRPPLLDALATLRPNVIYTLAPPKALAAAANAFSQGLVKSFRWGGSGLLLEAVLDAADEMAVRFTCPEGELVTVCDCGAPGKCRHTLAAAMTIARVLHDSRFHAADLPPNRLDALRKQLRVESQPAAPARLIFLQPAAGGRWEIDYDSGQREASWRVTDPPAGLEWLRWQDTRPEAVAEAFGRWLGDRAGTLVEVRAGEDVFSLAHPEMETLRARTEVALRGGLVEVRRALVDARGAVETVFHDLGRGMAFLPERKIFARLDPADAWAEFSRLGGRTATPVVTLHQSGFVKPDGPCTLLDANGRPVAAVAAAVRPAVHVTSGLVTYSVSVRVTDDIGPIPVHAALDALFAELFEDGPFALLVKSPARRRVLAAAFLRAFAAEAPDAILEEAEHDPAFVNPSMHGTDAKCCLRHLLDGVTRLDEPRLAADPARSPHPWLRCEGTGRALVTALAALSDAFPEADILRARDLSAGMAPQVFQEGFQRLAAACAARGVDLRVDDSAARSSDFTFRVRVVRSDDLDWFELHPEAQAGAFSIPRSRWDEILRTGRFVDDDGATVFLDPQALDLFRRFADMAARKRQPRLRLFDWLALREEGVDCELPADDEAVISALRTLDGIPAQPAPGGLKAELRAYQRHGFDWLCFLYRHRFGACLADDMGLGKTLQAIALLAALHEGIVTRHSSAPHLIVLPPTLLFNWQAELERFAPALAVTEYTGQRRKAEFAGRDVVLTTYELARRDIDTLAKHSFDVIIFDEAQAVKNAAAARTQAVALLQGRFRLCLTGTPLENHAGEFHSIMETAVPGVFGDRREFLRGHEAGEPVLRRARPFLLRRTKEKILDELPPKIESDRYFALSDAQREFYTRAVGEVRREVLAAYDDRPAQQAGIVALAALTRLRQICIAPALIAPECPPDSPKIEHLVTELAELTEEGHAALIFSQFVKALDLVSSTLESAGLAHLRLDGSTPVAARRQRVEAFQSGQGPGIFLISLKTGGSGLNLTRAGYVYHLDPWWNPAVERQAGDRAHRIGQKNSVYVQRLLMRHTVEEKMMTLKHRKDALFREVVEGGATSAAAGASGLTATDFEFLVDA